MTLTDDTRRDHLLRLAVRLGYAPGMISQDFPVWVADRVITADVVAFTRPRPEPQDQTTSALVGVDVYSDQDRVGAVSLSRALAAPAVAFAGDTGIDLWSVGTKHEQRHMYRLGYHEVDDPPGNLVAQLGPRNLFAAKNAGYQPALFPTDVAGLLHEARHESAARLIQIVEDAAVHLSSRPTDPMDERRKRAEVSRVSRLLVGAIAALMVSDKIVVDRDQSPEVVLQRAVDRFGSYFSWTDDLTDADHASLLSTITLLGQDVSYAGLDPTVVASVYESAILDAASRADFGVFYTPPALAARVLDQIPLEEVDPAGRHVLDPSCGSGTFLLAAYDRLRSIAPIDMDLFEVHADTSRRLTGIDIDPLAVEVARLALLLNALPAGNGWHVQQGDALASDSEMTASVVVSNPPWRDLRSDEGKRRQLADRFIMSMLTMVEPDGYLATVVPGGWLSSRTSRAARLAVAAECGLFEVWRLPQDTFPRVDIDVAVIMAQRDRPAGGYVFRRVRRARGWQQRFLDGGRPSDETYLAREDRRLQPESWLHGPLDSYGDGLRQLPSLASIARIGKGPVPTPPVRERGGSGAHAWLRRFSGTRAYAPVSPLQLMPVRYPEEFNWRTDDGSEYERPKVLVSGVRNPDIPWRLKVVPDLGGGIIPRESVSVVIPHGDSTSAVYALCALLGSSLASCWIDTLSPRSIPIPLLRGMPVPEAGGAWGELADAGRRLVELASDQSLSSEDLRAVDRLVVASYGLPDDVFLRLATHFAGVPAPEGGVRYPARDDTLLQAAEISRAPRIRAFGAVLDVAPTQICLWIAGVTAEDGEWRDVPPGFPGSQVYAGATFEVVLDGRDVDDARFEFQSEGYLELSDFMVSRQA